MYKDIPNWNRKGLTVVSGCPRSGTSLMMDCLRTAFGDDRIIGNKFPQEERVNLGLDKHTEETDDEFAARRYVTDPINTEAYSAVFWIKGVYQGNTVIMEKGNNANLMLQPTGGGELFYLNSSDPLPDASLVLNALCNHIAMVFDGSMKYFYLNSVLIHSESMGTPENVADPLSVGGRILEGAYHASVTLGDTGIHSGALTAAMVSEIYSGGSLSLVTNSSSSGGV